MKNVLFSLDERDELPDSTAAMTSATPASVAASTAKKTKKKSKRKKINSMMEKIVSKVNILVFDDEVNFAWRQFFEPYF